MAVSSKKRDQGEKDSRNNGDCALQIEPKQHRNEPQTTID
jgi:hypothetical protein